MKSLLKKTSKTELITVSRKIDMWTLGHSEMQRAFRTMSSKVHVDKVPSHTLLAEMVDFEKFFQQTGGQQGHWMTWIIRSL